MPTSAASSGVYSAYKAGRKTNTAVTNVFKPNAGSENPINRGTVVATSLVGVFESVFIVKWRPRIDLERIDTKNSCADGVTIPVSG